MDWSWIALSLIALAYVVRALLNISKNKHKRLPPGPRGIPILGNLHMLGELPHQDLLRLAKRYGPIMYMRFALVPTIVVSSPQAAEQFLKTNDLVFAGRPPHEGSRIVSYDRKGISFTDYGPYWRNMRKLCTLGLLSNLRISSFQPLRREELDLLIKSLKEAALARTAVDLSAKISSLSADMSCRMIFGKKYMDKDIDERGFKAVIQEGLARRMKAISKVFDAFFEKIIDDHIHEPKEEGQPKDLIDVMLGYMGSKENEFQIERSNIKALVLDMLAGSMDTSATAIEWALAELLKNPRIMKKVQEELEKVVGMERKVEESDLESLEYLDMVVKETLRLHPVAPLLIPHESLEDCTINGFHIPQKSRVIVNTYAIGRDPNVWTDAEKFLPERFIGSSIDLRGRDFQLIPFGSGRRGCPGMQLGLTVVRLVLAQLVHCFDWELPNGMMPSELDMTEEFGLTVPRAKHLLAVPTYRLPN
ncbi:Cytochrome P450 CYP736A12 [Vitis vinifera]|uniref:Cytochrome P450 CYP736A12 n=1 Tax=Vitis vinifera TaxID=29760 RepID=A0A438KK42_VITVI|nr:Cytochrome P450 CYP736A12 [Vitis vinifera]